MKIFLGTDHAGYELKEKIKQWLKEWDYDYEDMGAFAYNEKDDYPDFIKPVAEEVALRQAQGDYDVRGIVIGGSGQGEAIVCNRHKGVRATVYAARSLDLELVKLMREHNDSNVLSLGARFVPEEDAKQVVKLWLETPFPGEERHKRRIAKMFKSTNIGCCGQLQNDV